MNPLYAFVLFMVVGGPNQNSGVAVIQQEFSTQERCESARKVLEAKITVAQRQPGPFFDHQGRIYASVCQPK